MRLTWAARASLRSFYLPTFHRLTVASDEVDDDVAARVYGKRLVLTFSAAGEFRDLELGPGPVRSARHGPTPDEVTSTDDVVAVWVPEMDEPVVEVSPAGTVTIWLSCTTPEVWLRLPGSGVLLGLVDENVLAAVRVVPEVDPSGECEARWLDSRGA